MTAVLPIIVRNKAASALKEATGREVRISSVSINPFTLTATVRDFAIAEKSGPPLFAFREATASLALASVYKRALILSELALDTPSFSLVRTAPNRFNFSDIIERQPKGEKPEQGKPLLFSLNNIIVKNGSIDFEDRAAGGRKHDVRNLQLTIPFISNIPYLADRYVDPRLAAVVDGAPFSFAGKLKPLSKSQEMSVRIGLKGLNLPQYLAYAPVPPPVALTSGRLTLDLDLAYRVSAEKKPELTLKGGAGLAEVRVDLPDGKPLLRLPSLELKADRLEVLAGSFEFGSIALNGIELFVDRDSKGRWMYQRILAGREKPKEPKESKEAKGEKGNEKSAFAAKSFVSSNGTVHFRDAVPKGGFSSTVSNLEIALQNFDTRPGRSSGYDLSLMADGNASLKSRGGFAVNPVSLNASLQIAGARLGRFWPYLQQYLTAPVQGTVGLSAAILYAEPDGLRVQKGDLSIDGLSARYGSNDGFDLATLQVKDASFQQSSNSLEVGEIRLSRGNLSLSREADGSLSPLSLLAKQPETKPSTPHKAHKETDGKSRAFSYLVKRFQLDGFKLAFVDKTYEEPPRFTLRNTSLTLSNLQGPKFAPMPMNFVSSYGKGTALKARGTLTPAPFRYQGMLSVARLPIRDFEPYFPDSFNFFVIDGNADLSLNLDVASRNGKTTGRFKGSAGVRDFHSIDSVADQDLLKWESLQFDEFQGELEPFSLSIRQVALNDVYSRIIIRKDGSLNLQDLIKEETPQQAAERPATATQPPAAATAAPPAVAVTDGAPSTPAAAPPRRQVSVSSVTIQNGTLSFTDNHLPQTFNSTFYNLGGRVSGLSSEESKFADVDLRGTLENHSPMQITGRLNPLRDDLFVDLKVSFRDIELSPVTPYSGTYLGYEIDKGKLFLDLKYLIEKKQLSSENRIFIDQFTFGNKVESKEATNLPVRLAIALLKDRKGEIHLDLPVTGRTDDPQFSIWRLIGQVLKNLLVKAATSPFALLSSLTGGGQDFSMVQFEPGSSSLSQGETQKLEKLAKVLADRPGVKMEIKGFVDKAKDPEGYRQELLERKLQHEKYLYLAKEQKSAEGESGAAVKLSEEEYTKLLKAVYKKEKFPKPRNALGLVKELPANEMRKLIIANTVVAETDLQSLARERSAAVFNYLVSRGGLPAERLFQGSEDIYRLPAQENAPRSRVEFSAIAR